MRDGVHIRLTLTRGVKITSGMDPRLNQSGPTLIVLAEHKPPVYAKTGLTLITSSIRRPPPEILDPRIHHANLLNSILAKIEANKAGADDALMLDLARLRGRDECDACLHRARRRGCTSRGRGLSGGDHAARPCWRFARERNSAREADLTLKEVYRADEMFCTGTMGELAGVIKVDGQSHWQRQAGCDDRAIELMLRQHTATEGVPVVSRFR